MSELCFEGDSSLRLLPKRFSVSGEGDLLRLVACCGEKRFLRGNAPRDTADVSLGIEFNEDFEEPAIGLVNNARFDEATDDGSGFAICKCC